ncbi:MAG: N-acetyl sugar amidotransferase [Agriterribacter sp.]
MINKPYQICCRCVMDSSDPDIDFDEQGICNHCRRFDELYKTIPKEHYSKSDLFIKTVEEIKKRSKGKSYDCILGLSGGTDSSFLAYLCKEYGLKPLVVHFDNGWNTEYAIRNIENLVKKLNFELYTYVINWEQFKELQLSYFRASVIDLEVPTDHLIFGALFKTAKKYNIHNVISGFNLTSEGIMPLKWLYEYKFDRANMKDIHRQFGTGEMNNLPTLGVWQRLYYYKWYQFKQYHLLQTFLYNKAEAQEILKQKFDWKDYGGKHFESVFTRFYQGYFLPVKFGIDKRRAHYSTLICSGQMSKKDALDKLKEPTYDLQLQQQDIEYVCKKWGISKEEFNKVMNMTVRSHNEFKEEQKIEKAINKIIQTIKPFVPNRFKNA